MQGDASPDLPAVTAWSTPGTFTVANTPPKPVSITCFNPSMSNGDPTAAAIQLSTPAPSGGQTVQLTSSNPTALPLPATASLGAGVAYAQFPVQAGLVDTPTVVTLTAACNGASAVTSVTVSAPDAEVRSDAVLHQRRRAVERHRDAHR